MGKGAPDPVLAHPPPKPQSNPSLWRGIVWAFHSSPYKNLTPILVILPLTTALSPSFANISPYFGLRGGNLWDQSSIPQRCARPRFGAPSPQTAFKPFFIDKQGQCTPFNLNQQIFKGLLIRVLLKVNYVSGICTHLRVITSMCIDISQILSLSSTLIG